MIPAHEQNITSVRQKNVEKQCRVPRQIIWPTLSCPSSLPQGLDEAPLFVDRVGRTRPSQYGRIRSQPIVVCAVITIPGSSSLRGTIRNGVAPVASSFPTHMSRNRRTRSYCNEGEFNLYNNQTDVTEHPQSNEFILYNLSAAFSFVLLGNNSDQPVQLNSPA